MEALEELVSRTKAPAARYLDVLQKERVEIKYCYASRRLLLLDYDGTLVPFHNRPEAAKPDTQLIHMLRHLAEDTANRLVIISGRDRHTLDEWLGDISLDLIAEHGAWHKGPTATGIAGRMPTAHGRVSSLKCWQLLPAARQVH